MEYKASVLIDDHPCRPDEVRVIGLALALARDVALGKLDNLRPHLVKLLGQECEPELISQINDLFWQMDSLLWNGRTPWTIYELSRASFPGLLTHGLETRLQQDETEVRRVNRVLHDLGYQPMIGDFQNGDRNEGSEEEKARKR